MVRLVIWDAIAPIMTSLWWMEDCCLFCAKPLYWLVLCCCQLGPLGHISVAFQQIQDFHWRKWMLKCFCGHLISLSVNEYVCFEARAAMCGMLRRHFGLYLLNNKIACTQIRWSLAVSNYAYWLNDIYSVLLYIIDLQTSFWKNSALYPAHVDRHLHNYSARPDIRLSARLQYFYCASNGDTILQPCAKPSKYDLFHPNSIAPISEK